MPRCRRVLRGGAGVTGEANVVCEKSDIRDRMGRPNKRATRALGRVWGRSERRCTMRCRWVGR
ncbi:hypothetical protein HOU52_gp37 [Arthrobacter phage Yang]|uniref:Uncharacterized protein n=1 Tax=Arthrobacter phage Yang TaxID=2419970 RepID=A0A3G2KJG3_9CAUD|nr:hypothetical protein HOU52_gp37 [Arthrobacter phage Yang]AYN59155.1 hypothetical protein PBI_YANG_37 [Arthrobacter phage Yang]